MNGYNVKIYGLLFLLQAGIKQNQYANLQYIKWLLK